MSVITRFAPSPTGFLHIGGARTALFNWLFAKHHGGQFLLRIEDTDKTRSTQAAIDAIIDGLHWMGLQWDGEVVFQSTRAPRHRAVVEELLGKGLAYYCYCTPEELRQKREVARAAGQQAIRYDGRCRHREPDDVPSGVTPAVRFKAPQEGDLVIEDGVMGEVRVANAQLDDMILLRADGSPTYMHSVVVDDHDMAITHVIRGADHLNNAFRQAQLYKALAWELPHFSHVPLIHGPDGAKLSKRHGALGVDAYRDMGFLPEAMRNYLLRLGWSHGDDEVISTEQAIDWFSLEGIGRSAARFDIAKLTNLNGHYIRQATDDRLVALIVPLLTKALGTPPNDIGLTRLRRGMDGLKQRAKTLLELAENAEFYVRTDTLPIKDQKAGNLLSGENRVFLQASRAAVCAVKEWSSAALENSIRDAAERQGVKLGKLAQPLRAAMTGTTNSPGIFEVMEVLGRKETLKRLENAENYAPQGEH